MLKEMPTSEVTNNYERDLFSQETQVGLDLNMH